MTPTTDRQLEAIREALAVFLRPGQVTELRALGVGGARAVTAFFRDPDALARRAAELDAQGARGVYFTPNPLRPDLVPQDAPSGKGSARKADVIARHWLLIDCDPVRVGPDGEPLEDQAVPSTEGEREAAWNVLDRCKGTLDAAGLRGAVVGDSGNGWHLCYPVDLPADDQTQDQVKALLKGLQKRCGDPTAKVDPSTHDAPRIWKLYGTTARKGPDTPERPHRLARLIEGSAPTAELAAANNALLSRLLGLWTRQDELRNPPRSPFAGREAVLARAKLYVAKEPPAVSGQRGHDRCFHVACVLVNDFALSEEEAFEAIQDWNRTCKPPWSVGELRHKLADAAKQPGPRGRLLNETGPNGATNYSFSDPLDSVPGREPKREPGTESFPEPIPASRLRLSDPEVKWLWHGYLYRGGITLLSALWKTGKTTLLAHLLKSFEAGTGLCGYATVPARVLYVTEENESRWAERRDHLGLTDHLEFLVRPFRSRPRPDQWTAFLAHVAALQAKRPADVLVFDTLANLWPVKDENDAAAVQSALMPLHGLVGQAALLAVHHARKSDGTEATAARGSGALSAFVDTIVELRRFNASDRKDRRRVLTGYGRSDETPDEVVVELTDAGYGTCGGDRHVVTCRSLSQTIREVLPTGPPGLTSGEILDAWPGDQKPKRESFLAALKNGAETGDWARNGEGKRGDPHRYWIPPVPDVF
jgi:hypothetical protein